jgi:hypothetical protein
MDEIDVTPASYPRRDFHRQSNTRKRGHPVHMRYDEIEQLRERHPAWALVRANNAALVLGFFGRVFIERNMGDLAATDLVRELDDELYALNQRLADDRFPRSAQAYLDEWASPERGWLRKFYPPGSDEPRYDISPAVEKTLLWVRDLRGRDFVGTESRLNTIFELLRQMVVGADDDPDRRLAELRRRRAEIDDEIAKAERGEVTVLDSAGLRDRYQQFSQTARELMSDFREVEENFRRLDRELRQRIAGWTGSKGALLDDVLGNRSSIAESDQGRSFQAFYDFLLSHQRQEELTDLLDRLRGLEIADHDDRLNRIHYDWMDASERTQATVRMLSEQLRRFLDDQVWLENRRVFDLLRTIEGKALRLRDCFDPAAMEVDESSVSVRLPTERPLYRRSTTTTLESDQASPGSTDFDATALVSQVHVDREELLQRVFASLGPRDQIGLRDVVVSTPLEHGLAELIGYLSLGEAGLSVVFDDEHREQVGWAVQEGDRIANMPRVTFSRDRTEVK